MGELVLLVVAAAWAAVLIPPLLRSRIENRPNSSVTDFRRQLNKLQSTVPSRASGSMRGMARPLAPSPLQRPGGRWPPRRPVRPDAPQRRSGARWPPRPVGHDRPGARAGAPPPPARRCHRRPARVRSASKGSRASMGSRATARRTSPVTMSAAEMLRRRRSNMLFMLVVATGATLFLAATTKAPAMLYLFAALVHGAVRVPVPPVAGPPA